VDSSTVSSLEGPVYHGTRHFHTFSAPPRSFNANRTPRRHTASILASASFANTHTVEISQGLNLSIMADQEPYATLPGTGHPGDVPHNWTDQKTKIHNLGWGGMFLVPSI
jgi:hypothetical protein